MMETKAGYVAVGLAAIAAMALFLGFMLFALKSPDSPRIFYRIEFEGGISGLSVGNEVRFNGIRVGEVRHIEIAPENPGLVRVIISVGVDVPIYADTEASVETVGITGLSVVYLTGGSAANPLLPTEGAAMATIRSRQSSLRSVFQKTPELLDSANILLRRGGDLLSGENEENLRRIIASLVTLSNHLDLRSQELKTSLDQFQNVLGKLDHLLVEDIPPAVSAFKRSFQRFYEVLDQAEPGLRRLSAMASDDLQHLMNEMQTLLRTMNTLAQRINADPRRFFFGDAAPGYTIK